MASRNFASCIYPECKNRDNIRPRRKQFFAFPIALDSRIKWLNNCGLLSGSGGDDFLCSDHFQDQDFLKDDGGKIVGLRLNAIPIKRLTEPIRLAASEDCIETPGISKKVQKLNVSRNGKVILECNLQPEKSFGTIKQSNIKKVILESRPADFSTTSNHKTVKIKPTPIVINSPFIASCYPYLIALALSQSHDGSMTVNEILRYMEENFTFEDVKNGIFRTLLNDARFLRKSENWAINPAMSIKVDQELRHWIKTNLKKLDRYCLHPILFFTRLEKTLKSDRTKSVASNKEIDSPKSPKSKKNSINEDSHKTSETHVPKLRLVDENILKGVITKQKLSPTKPNYEKSDCHVKAQVVQKVQEVLIKSEEDDNLTQQPNEYFHSSATSCDMTPSLPSLDDDAVDPLNLSSESMDNFANQPVSPPHAIGENIEYKMQECRICGLLGTRLDFYSPHECSKACHLRGKENGTKKVVKRTSTETNMKEFELPFGWKKKASQRTSGKTQGHWDIYLFSPDGAKFRSNVEVNTYLQKNPTIEYDPSVTNCNRPRELLCVSSSPKRKRLMDTQEPNKSAKRPKILESKFPNDVGNNEEVTSCASLKEILVSASNTHRVFVLPYDWKKYAFQRACGTRWDVHLVEPSGNRLRSNKEIQEFIMLNPHVKYNPGLTNVEWPRDATGLWNFFNLENGMMTCLKCFKEFVYQDSIVFFEKHLMDKHCVVLRQSGSNEECFQNISMEILGGESHQVQLQNLPNDDFKMLNTVNEKTSKSKVINADDPENDLQIDAELRSKMRQYYRFYPTSVKCRLCNRNSKSLNRLYNQKLDISGKMRSHLKKRHGTVFSAILDSLYEIEEDSNPDKSSQVHSIKISTIPDQMKNDEKCNQALCDMCGKSENHVGGIHCSKCLKWFAGKECPRMDWWCAPCMSKDIPKAVQLDHCYAKELQIENDHSYAAQPNHSNVNVEEALDNLDEQNVNTDVIQIVSVSSVPDEEFNERGSTSNQYCDKNDALTKNCDPASVEELLFCENFMIANCTLPKEMQDESNPMKHQHIECKHPSGSFEQDSEANSDEADDELGLKIESVYSLQEKTKRYPEPAYPIQCLIALAFRNSSRKELRLKEMCSFIKDSFPYYENASTPLEKCVADELLQNPAFEEVHSGCSGPKLSKKWMMHSNFEREFLELIVESNKKKPLTNSASVANPDLLSAIINGKLKEKKTANTSKKTKIPCPLCPFKASFKSDLSKHSIDVHESKDNHGNQDLVVKEVLDDDIQNVTSAIEIEDHYYELLPIENTKKKQQRSQQEKTPRVVIDKLLHKPSTKYFVLSAPKVLMK